ncbi:Ribosomal protein L13e containing protein [Daphnia sinensis]|uniref:60S ribosomal protein L13 n=1 Tax=Daphnia sinensis TaxID=1820382 RepID=A0AAD5PK70_9CRUS|nr:Ribosomal protein L13e containing protein [Daphnia sinensis]
MVKHNNVIPNNHFRKHWQRNVRVWLNQSQRKHRRLIARRAKAASLSPRPIEALRPAVRCQTIRYNHRARLGRGFTLAEVKAAGLGVQFARSVGISVDHRRKNRNQESLELNKNRLLAYVNKLVLFPRNEKAQSPRPSQDNQKVASASTVNALPALVKRVRSVSKLELERLRKTGAYRSLRQEWNNQRNEGKRLKKEREAAEKN